MHYLGIQLSMHSRMIMKEAKENLNSKKCTMFIDWRFNIENMITWHKYILNHFYQNSNNNFCRRRQIYSKTTMKNHNSWNSSNNLIKNQVRNLILPTIKVYYLATVISILLKWREERHRSIKQNRGPGNKSVSRFIYIYIYI